MFILNKMRHNKRSIGLHLQSLHQLVSSPTRCVATKSCYVSVGVPGPTNRKFVHLLSLCFGISSNGTPCVLNNRPADSSWDNYKDLKQIWSKSTMRVSWRSDRNRFSYFLLRQSWFSHLAHVWIKVVKTDPNLRAKLWRSMFQATSFTSDSQNFRLFTFKF